jgi:hypothetical protein
MNIMQRPGQNAELKFLHQRRFHLLPATFAAAAADSSEVTETGRRYVLNLFRTPWLRALMSERAQATCMPMSSDARPVLRKGYIQLWLRLGLVGAHFYLLFLQTRARGGIKTMPVKASFFHHISEFPCHIRRIKR